MSGLSSGTKSSIIFLIIGVAFGTCVGHSLGEGSAEGETIATANALSEKISENEALEQAANKIQSKLSSCKVSLYESGEILKSVEAEALRLRDNRRSDCEGVPLPEWLVPLHKKCVAAWEECEWDKGHKVTDKNGVENVCETRVSSCRALMSSAQPNSRGW